MTKGQLIDMDDRFLDWIKDPDVYHVIDEESQHKYITVHKTGDEEISVKGFDDIKELKKHCCAVLCEDSSWYLVAIFDLEKKKEVEYKEIIRLDIKGLDY